MAKVSVFAVINLDLVLNAPDIDGAGDSLVKFAQYGYQVLLVSGKPESERRAISLKLWDAQLYLDSTDDERVTVTGKPRLVLNCTDARAYAQEACERMGITRETLFVESDLEGAARIAKAKSREYINSLTGKK